MFSRLVTFSILLIGTLMCAHAADVTIEAYELRFSSGGIPEGALPLRLLLGSPVKRLRITACDVEKLAGTVVSLAPHELHQ